MTLPEQSVLQAVTRIELYRVRIPLAAPFRTAHGVQRERDVIVLAARDVEGRTGWGECVAMNQPGYSSEYTEGAAHVLTHHLVPNVMAGEPMSSVAGHPMAKAALEMALLDLALRRSSRSLTAELGGHGRPVVVGAVVGLTSDVASLMAEVDRLVEDGYTRIKVKVRPGWDRVPLAAVRTAHPELDLWADANGEYGPDDLAALCGLDDLELGLIEQPFDADELLLHATLAEVAETPVCLDESIVSPGTLRVAIELGAIDVLNLKPGRVGGLRAALHLLDMCRGHGIDVWCGGMLETGIGRAANLALATVPGMTLPGDLSASARYFPRDLTAPFELGPGGTLTPPSGFGLGLGPDPDALAAMATSIRTIHP